MKPIERIAMYLKFRNISPHAFEKKIHLSNGYFSKQLRNLGSVGSDILIKIHEHYQDLNILWVLIGEGQMIKEEMMGDPADESQLNQFSSRYIMENGKLKILEEDLEKMQYVIKDKEKIISLYEFMLNNNTLSATIADTATTA
ncbi:MAG: hypothetical protein WCP61_02155 [Chitinophagia bacterium]|jgi:hypothetical protein